GDAGLMHTDMADMDEQALIFLEGAMHHLAGEIHPDRTGTGDALQHETHATEEADAEALLPDNFQLHGFLGAEEGLAPADEALAGFQFPRHDGAGETRREGKLAFAIGGEIGNEEAAAADAAHQSGHQPA